MVLSALFWSVFSFFAIFCAGEMVGMNAQSNIDFICELNLAEFGLVFQFEAFDFSDDSCSACEFCMIIQQFSTITYFSFL